MRPSGKLPTALPSRQKGGVTSTPRGGCDDVILAGGASGFKICIFRFEIVKITYSPHQNIERAAGRWGLLSIDAC